MSSYADTLTGITELAAEVRKNLALHEFDTPLMTHLNEALFGKEFDAKRGAMFKAGSVSVSVQNAGHPTLTVYGQMTFKDRKDGGARVNVRADGHAWCRSSAWDGRGYNEMPEGARKRVAEMVAAVVRELVPTDQHWKMLEREGKGGELEAKVRGSISDSYRALEHCLRVLGAES